MHRIDEGSREGLPVLFLHAFPLHLGMWSRQFAAVAATQRAIACDLRGFGETPLGGGAFLLDHLVDDVLGMLDELRVERAAVVGLSMGGYVALRLAERAPHRVRALALCDTRAEPDDDATKEKRAAAIRKIAGEGVEAFAETFVPSVLRPQPEPDVVTRVRAAALAASPEALRAALAAMAARTDARPSLTKIAVPTLVVVGEHDAATPPAAARALASAIDGAELHVISGAGHMSNLENPEAFDGHLLRFLRRVRG